MNTHTAGYDTPEQRTLFHAYNEFIADFVERHGRCQATYDESHERAGQLVALGQGLVDLLRKCEIGTSYVNEMIDANGDIEAHEEYLVSVAAALADAEAVK